MDTPVDKVEDVMRTGLHMISGLASIKDTIDKMSRADVNSLIVERRDDGDEYGLITVEDIAAQVVAVNRSSERTNVYEIMKKPALTINADMKVKYAIRLLAELGLGKALVAGGEGLIGYVTLGDLVLSYAGSEATAASETSTTES